jgi:hypothetical protein
MSTIKKTMMTTSKTATIPLETPMMIPAEADCWALPVETVGGSVIVGTAEVLEESVALLLLLVVVVWSVEVVVGKAAVRDGGS